MQRLVLRRRADAPICRKVVQKGGYLLLTHRRRMPALVEQHETSDPAAVSDLRSSAVVSNPEATAHSFQKPILSSRIGRRTQVRQRNGGRMGDRHTSLSAKPDSDAESNSDAASHFAGAASNS